MGTPEIKATSFLLDETRTPICHSLSHPGGIKALWIRGSVANIVEEHRLTSSLPLQELGCVSKPECSLFILDIVC